MRIPVLAAAALLAFTAGCATAVPAAATVAPARAVFTGLALRDPTVMQSFAYDPVHRVWIFAQLTWGQPASAGDLTLTRVSAAGVRLGWMHLRGFGHGLSVGAEPCGTGTCVWAEARAVAEPALGWALPGSYGTGIARFAWRSSATLTPSSAGVAVYAPNGGQPEQTPSVDWADRLIAVQYWSAALRVFRWAVYPLAAFRARDYTAAARVTVPAVLAASGRTEQGWALAGRGTLVNWQGEAYSAANPPPGDATFATVTMSGAVASGRAACTGFASGAAGARRANVYCTSFPT
jgi:hypothetical protein